jgi:endonuclease/exonuclease/phosphatase family metal-dependent hydrolase
MSRWLFAFAPLAAALAVAPSGSTAPVARDLPKVVPHRPGEISLLTYNVQDLPFRIAGDRTGALSAIGDRLARLRQRNAAPHVVVLQEAFSEQSAAMLKAAGYRHLAFGPPVEAKRSSAPEPLDRDFLAARSAMRGEKRAAILSSGLIIASDFPIESSAATVFPADVCAGIDCLANKGVMLARVRVPGMTTPLEILNVHLNSGRKSRTPAAHNLYAYRQQLKAIDRFVTQHSDAAALRIFAGDFNVSHSSARLASLVTHSRGWQLQPMTAMGKSDYEVGCHATQTACTGPLAIAANVPLIHTLDWQFSGQPRTAVARPISRVVLFGREAGAGMLSDHIGYAVRYRVAG